MGESEAFHCRKGRVIQVLSIKAAARIECDVQTHCQIETLQMIDAARARFSDEIGQLHAEYARCCDRIRRLANDEIARFRLATDAALSAWQRAHIGDFVALEKEYALAVVRELQRPIKTRLDFEKQARELVRQNEFEA
jgi:hypothetical protein